ncbi:MAG: histidine decarboxylase, partial [Chloroflexota bacterium]|nr:histidine decarboxylase [Chloroflexota bacterium]
SRSLSVAQYAVDRFNEAGIPAWRNRNSLTVVFPRPSDEVVRRWQIAPFEDIAHIIAMPHVTREVVNALIDDIKNG